MTDKNSNSEDLLEDTVETPYEFTEEFDAKNPRAEVEFKGVRDLNIVPRILGALVTLFVFSQLFKFIVNKFNLDFNYADLMGLIMTVSSWVTIAALVFLFATGTMKYIIRNFDAIFSMTTKTSYNAMERLYGHYNRFTEKGTKVILWSGSIMAVSNLILKYLLKG